MGMKKETCAYNAVAVHPPAFKDVAMANDF